MTLPSRTLAALAVAGSLPLFAGSAMAAPAGQSMGLKNADVSTMQDVQYRYRRGARLVRPAAAGLAAGALVGGAFARAYGPGYYAYGAAPGYGNLGAYAGARYRANAEIYDTPQYGSCSGDRDSDSGYPSWACW